MAKLFVILTGSEVHAPELFYVKGSASGLTHGIFQTRLQAECYAHSLEHGASDEEAAEDWRQYLSDMADYRDMIADNCAMSDKEFWGEDLESWENQWDNPEPEPEPVPSHTLKELQLLRNPLPSQNKGLNEPDWDEIPF